MPVRYDQETKAKAIRLVREHAGDYPSEYAAITAVARRLGMTAETLRKWIRQAGIDEGQAPRRALVVSMDRPAGGRFGQSPGLFSRCASLGEMPAAFRPHVISRSAVVFPGFW